MTPPRDHARRLAALVAQGWEPVAPGSCTVRDPSGWRTYRTLRGGELAAAERLAAKDAAAAQRARRAA